MDRNPDSTHLEVHFNLICFQVLLTPHIATQRLRKIHNWYTSGAFLLVLSYKEEILSILYRLHWIWTELSHDVLNPAHVPLSLANSQTLGTYYRPRMR